MVGFDDGMAEPEVLAEATPHELVGDAVFCTSIAGEEIGCILTWGTHPAREGEYRYATSAQSALLPALWAILHRAA